MAAVMSWLLLAPARAGDFAPITGLTEPYLDVNLSASVPGIITRECFKEGQPVKKGEAVMELDQKLEELEAARRKAVMDKAKTDLDATRCWWKRPNP